MGSLFGGDSGKQEVSNEPWEHAKPHLYRIMKYADEMYQDPESRPTYFPGSTVAPLSGYSQGAIEAMARRAQEGSPLSDAARRSALHAATGGYAGGPGYDYMTGPLGDYMGHTMARAMETNPALAGIAERAGGSMIGQNPFIDEYAGRIGDRMRESYFEGMRPGMEAALSASGRGRSRYTDDYAGLGQNQLQRSDEAFARSLGDTMAQVYMGDYRAERAAQDAAARDWLGGHNAWLTGLRDSSRLGGQYATNLDVMYGSDADQILRGGAMADQLAQGDYADIGYLGRAGGMLDEQTRRELADEIARHEYGEGLGPGSDTAALGRYFDFVSGVSRPYSTQMQSGGGPSTFQQLAGLGIGAAGAAAGLGWAPFATQAAGTIAYPGGTPPTIERTGPWQGGGWQNPGWQVPLFP